MGLKSYVTQTLWDIVKEAPRKAFWALLGVAALWIATAIYGARSFPASFSEFVEVVKPTRLIEVAVESPIHTAINISFLGVLIAMWRVLKHARTTLDAQEDLIKGSATYKALVESVGLHSRWPHALQDGTGAPWQTLADDIARSDNSFVYVLGANGADTFCRPDSPLHASLSSFSGTIRVVLCDPNAPATKARAKAVSSDVQEYISCIRRSKKFLEQLSGQGKPVECRYYDGQPNWKLIITSNMLWLQYYAVSGPDVAKTQVFIFQNSNPHEGFYKLFRMEFERIWNRCKKPDAPKTGRRGR